MRWGTRWHRLKACILIKTATGKFPAVAKVVPHLKGVKAAFSVMGRTDVVANVDVPDLRSLSDLALRIGKIPDVVATETLIGLEV